MTLLKPPQTATLKSGAHQNSGPLTLVIDAARSATLGAIASTETGDKLFAKIVDAQLASDSAHYQTMGQQVQHSVNSNIPQQGQGQAVHVLGYPYGQPAMGIQNMQQIQSSPPKPAEGIDATLAERGSLYGEFTTHAYITQRLKQVMADSPKWGELNSDQAEALEMIVHKIGRILNGDPHYHDSWHDIVGYAKLVADRLASGK